LGVEREYYRPVERGFEAELAERLEKIRERLRSGREITAEDAEERRG
jgi:putative ATPase